MQLGHVFEPAWVMKRKHDCFIGYISKDKVKARNGYLSQGVTLLNKGLNCFLTSTRADGSFRQTILYRVYLTGQGERRGISFFPHL